MKLMNISAVLLLVLLVGSCASSSADGERLDIPQDGPGRGDTTTDLPDRGDGLAADAAPLDVPADVPPPVDPGIRLREEGWLRGDLHLHTLYQGGDDPVEIVLAVAEYLEDPDFLSAHPEYLGNGLDFLAITDHREASVADDPAFTSDRLILLSGEEFGGPGHAGLWGVTETVDHDPDGDGATLEDYMAGAENAHAQGGLFSPNHPFLTSIPFGWDLRTHDAFELINAGWALGSADFTMELLEEWEASHGPASPLFRKAVAHTGGGGSMQALVWYEAQLARGIHVALVGGSDRHVLFPAGFPTTWVRADSADQAGVLAGIRARRTFVSRTPAAATVELSVTTPDGTFGIGDRIPAAADVLLRCRVGRADGGLLRVVTGHAVPNDEALAAAVLEDQVLEIPVAGDDFHWETALEVSAGDWLYAMVLEPLVAPGLSEELAAQVPETASLAAAAGVEDYDGLVNIFLEHLEISTLLKPGDCDPALWVPERLQCMVADDHGIATYYIPDWLDRTLHAWSVDGAVTDYCVGAVASAVLFE
jgi:hypothetical protein